MSLSCSCGDPEDCDWYWHEPADYSTLDTKRRRRCKSCGTLIDVGSIVAMFLRDRYANGDIEERIYGEGCEIPMAEWYHCETCADLYFSLSELGFCVSPDEDMRGLVKEYAAMAAQQRNSKAT
jgi:hypothetical protein